MTLGAEGGIEDPLGSRREGFKDVIKVLHGFSPGMPQPLTASAVGRSRPAPRAAVSRVAAAAIHAALDTASTVLSSKGQQRTTRKGKNTEHGWARARLVGQLFLLSVLAIKQPAERQARKASLRGGHFNIVQIMRPRQRRTVGRRHPTVRASMSGADAAADCA